MPHCAKNLSYNLWLGYNFYHLQLLHHRILILIQQLGCRYYLPYLVIPTHLSSGHILLQMVIQRKRLKFSSGEHRSEKQKNKPDVSYRWATSQLSLSHHHSCSYSAIQLWAVNSMEAVSIQRWPILPFQHLHSKVVCLVFLPMTFSPKCYEWSKNCEYLKIETSFGKP